MIPSLRDWHKKYSPEGFTVIANHYPEFDYETDFGLLKQAVQELNVTYPVVQDNEGLIWRAYNNRYWPTQYLIDKWGNIRYTHIGEGGDDETEAVIQVLLAEPYP
jgi:hypothetical protein